MAFEKLESDIPACCRLALRFDGLDTSGLDALPREPDNADQINLQRAKWVLKTLDRDWTPLSARWPAIRRLLEDFPGEIHFAHFSRLAPGQVLDIHRDGIDRQDGRRDRYEMFNSTLRFHVPLKTNDRAYNFVDGKFYAMQQGECWMLHNMLYHGAINAHPTEDRYHLIFDVIPNEATMALIEQADIDVGFADAAFAERTWPGEEQI